MRVEGFAGRYTVRVSLRVRVQGLNGVARHDLLVGVGVPLGEEVAERLLELRLHLLGVRAGVRVEKG